MPKKYAILVTENTLPLIQFLNDGHEVTVNGEKPYYFLFTINSPNEITVDKYCFQMEDDLYKENGFLKDNGIHLMIG